MTPLFTIGANGSQGTNCEFGISRNSLYYLVELLNSSVVVVDMIILVHTFVIRLSFYIVIRMMMLAFHVFDSR
jgi:hypothetical protein